MGLPPGGMVTEAMLSTAAMVNAVAPEPITTFCTLLMALVVTVPSGATALSLRELEAPELNGTDDTALPAAWAVAVGASSALARAARSALRTSPLSAPPY